jgi:cell pole-organizing protein PopZ
MEDILTSIRRILSEEGSEDTATLEQEEAMAREQSPESQPDMGIDFTEIESDDQPGDMAPAGPAPAAAGRAKPMDDNILLLTPEMRAPAGDPVMSSATAEASADALTQLARAILDHRDINIGTREVTLETMVRQMLRPLLKEWLDRNLPYLIERLVKKEIDLMINRAERL